MDLSAFIVVSLGILLFVGGTAWLEFRSRKEKRRDGQGEQTPPAASTTPAGRTRHGRVAKSE